MKNKKLKIKNFFFFFFFRFFFFFNKDFKLTEGYKNYQQKIALIFLIFFFIHILWSSNTEQKPVNFFNKKKVGVIHFFNFKDGF